MDSTLYSYDDYYDFTLDSYYNDYYEDELCDKISVMC